MEEKNNLFNYFCIVFLIFNSSYNVVNKGAIKRNKTEVMKYLCIRII